MSKSLFWSGAVSTLALVAALVAVGCGPVTETVLPDLSGKERIKAVATVGMVADTVASVGGERVEVEALMGSGVDPHVYKASEGDVRRLERADIIFYAGLHLEAKMADVLERIGDRRRTQAVTDAVPRAQLLQPAEFEGNYDPHLWFDVDLWRSVVEQVRDTLIEADPAHADEYRANAEVFDAELRELHRYVGEQAARVGEQQRVLITAHDAFNYFGRAYGFEVHGLQGISTAAEAGTRDVQKLAEFIAEREIPAVFVESSVSPRTIRAVQEAVQARGFDVQIGGSLYSDAMGTAGTPDGTYIGMVRHNIDTIVSALRGEATKEEEA